ncbi:hypothetical protein CJ030_MR4G000589 [Morella rubra]|uniref:GRF-type domain-containing protein n=1 Tax=Morella rubra TaxID=262757 RepID=A0A6A1VWC0_9ROSI|nr:hypothetical protein CJ030_MR4G000589 [Morella rubra]
MTSTISTSSSTGCDDGVSNEVLPQPLCKCGIPAKLRTSMTSGNPRRRFYGCQQYNKTTQVGCDFFQWLDPPVCIEKMLREEIVSSGDVKDVAEVIRMLNSMDKQMERVVEHQKKIDDQFQRVLDQIKLVDAQLRCHIAKENRLKAIMIGVLVIVFGFVRC